MITWTPKNPEDVLYRVIVDYLTFIKHNCYSVLLKLLPYNKMGLRSIFTLNNLFLLIPVQ